MYTFQILAVLRFVSHLHEDLEMSGLSQAAGFLASFKIRDLFFFLTSNATLQKKTSLIELIGMISKY